MHFTLKKLSLLLLWLTVIQWCRSQTNCRVFTDSCHIKACLIYNAADSFHQGTRLSQQYYDSAIRTCPDYAEAWRAISVPYLKRGDFFTWRKYLDKAVALKPFPNLGIRGWCRWKFLRDYEGALTDLRQFDTLSGFHPANSGDGYFNLYIVMAICEREQGNYQQAFHYFSLGIDSVLKQQGDKWIGFSDYLHRCVTRMRIKDYTGALLDLDLQIKKYDNFAEIYYYQGLIFHLLHREKEAITILEKAEALLTANHHLSDIYCEMPDEVFMEDIEEAIDRIKKE
ncbi:MULTISPECIES: tetratricopeptide repeat protein [Niastella]|uniref:Tetratricopeptide repeat protein n=1 Tax=Niastella soli TaxID=2821487 RepID=A0ABS3YW77_9BACT|nr:tetratricopeptide repeat protein [Niastella soli]MBO9202175.1 tetratricopeptide repeat protein [Niastella soli]